MIWTVLVFQKYISQN